MRRGARRGRRGSEKLQLGYTLASDFWPHGAATKAYGVFNEERGAPVRGTFLIDKTGVVVWTLVNEPDTRRERARQRAARRRARVTPRSPRMGRRRGSPPLVCLHGVTSHGRHFAELAERLADRFHVIALDLRGHGASSWEPPWNLEQHVADVLEAAPEERCAWLGHSFGGRIAYEVAAAAPERVDRLVLLDPAIRIPPDVGLAAAENARRDRSYVSFAEGIDRRYEESVLTTAPRELVEEELRVHLLEDDDGRFRYRYCQSTVVAAYGEMTREPPPFEHVRIPTLLVLGETLVPPVRRSARRAPGRARRPARGRRHPRGAHRAVGRVRRDRRAVERFLA